MRQRKIRAALIALAAGGLVAVSNPAPRVAHEAEVAMASAGQLAQQGAVAVTARLRGCAADKPVARRAVVPYLFTDESSRAFP